jgi:hypothetical protein
VYSLSLCFARLQVFLSNQFYEDLKRIYELKGLIDIGEEQEDIKPEALTQLE